MQKEIGIGVEVLSIEESIGDALVCGDTMVYIITDDHEYRQIFLMMKKECTGSGHRCGFVVSFEGLAMGLRCSIGPHRTMSPHSVLRGPG